MLIIRNILDFFFPPLCLLCKKVLNNTKIICKDCFEEIARLLIKEPVCPFCGKTKKYGHKCDKEYKFDEIVPLFHYRGKIVRLIHEYKYKRKTKLSQIFIPFLKTRLSTRIREKYNCIISVPIHPARKRERGFDQNEIFCKEISKMLEIPYLKEGVHRIKYTKPQSRLKKQEREANIKGVFETYQNWKEKKVLIFDDILTTGATLNELSIILKEKGAKKICVVTLAIA